MILLISIFITFKKGLINRKVSSLVLECQIGTRF